MGQIGANLADRLLKLLGQEVGGFIAVVEAELGVREVIDDWQDNVAPHGLLEGAVHRRDTCDEVVAVEAVLIDGIFDCLGELVLARFSYLCHSEMGFEVELMGDATPFYTAA